MERECLLSVEDLSVTFTQYGKGLKRRELPVIDHLDLTVHAGELTAVVGASGSGKSLLAHAVLGLLPYNAAMGGTIRYRGQELDEARLQSLRGREIVLVPQSVSFLDPLMKVGNQVRNGRRSVPVRKRCRELLSRYGLGPEVEAMYPSELSGGMTRRVLISTALMDEPRLIIADEPTPGLHLEAARRVLGHFREMADQGAGVLLITHDLELALEVADRIGVFYAGTTVEEGAASRFQREERLGHPYSRALFRAMPEHGFEALPGTQPYVTDRGAGCVFRGRCPYRGPECESGEISPRGREDGFVRCLRVLGETGEEAVL